MAAPYWGQLPKPSVVAPFKADGPTKYRGPGNLSIDTTGNRTSNEYPPQSQPRQYRNSTQTEAPTISTLSPFASPIASSFRGDGLAPRPPSFPYPATEQLQKDYLDKRRRRVSRNKEIYDDPSSIPLPAAPDVPRQPPPLSYRPSQASSQFPPPAQSRSARRTDKPISSSRAPPPEEYYRSRPVDDIRRGTSGKAAARDPVNLSENVMQPESLGRKSRKTSLSEEQRRREWASDRSPLQRLELTLDSITKEEKRARVEEAERLARESKGREGVTRNSVRFRNRPIAIAPEVAQVEPATSSRPRARSPPESKGNLRPPEISRAVGKSAGDQPASEVADGPSPNQRGSNNKTRSAVPVAVAVAAGAAAGGLGLSRSTSNKLKKDPPEDPWLHRRVDAERQFLEVRPRRQSTDATQAAGHSNTSPPTPSNPYSQNQVEEKDEEKALPALPNQSKRLQDDMAPRPGGRRLAKKVEPLGVPRPVENRSRLINGGDLRADQIVTVNGIQYVVPPTAENRASGRHDGTHSSKNQHHLPSVFHRDKHNQPPSDGIYVPTGRLDEWKKGGVALLSGDLLDLDVIDQSEVEQDKTWWEAGHTGQRRRSSTNHRKAEAYDGEYDDNNGTVPDISNSLGECKWCATERLKHPKERKHFRHIKLRDLHYAGYDKKTKSKVVQRDKRPLVEPEAETTVLLSKSVASEAPLQAVSLEDLLNVSFPADMEHLLTCPMRGIRVRPNIAPTRFKPPLFLKSGPLLRYCGLRRERLQGRSQRDEGPSEREIWRGSVMIVTQDNHSSYELKPTLRLFLQPMDLLPPPPAELEEEELASEYVDPIAGLSKIGRDGRTLYVRPVEHLEQKKDLSLEESDDGLFETTRSPLDGASEKKPAVQKSQYDGEKAGKYKEVRGFRLHAEQGVTFWRFNIEIELRNKQQRIAYRINRGPATGFWVPSRGQPMNIMFHSCNGFSHGIDPNEFSGPDPMWRDVLNTHQTQPFHVMLGGGDQLYNDSVTEHSPLFRQWCAIKDPHHKEGIPFTLEMQTELEAFYLNRYCMWFSQGLFGLATSQIPMINIFDDHDIIDGFGSYPDDYMSSPIFAGLGCVAFKYYMLFQHQSSIDEGEENEPSWVLGTQPGPYIKELSRTVFTHLGRSVAFLGLDCRTERMNDEIVSAETYHKLFGRLEKGIVKGETKHLIVLVGVPMAYPRMVWLENILTSRFIQPVKALGRAGLFGQGLLNKMDGGVEILDDLDDHWTARHHKDERNWLIQELQDLAAEKSVRVTILGGDVHLGAIGQFYSNPKLGIPKDKDHRYMPNIISSAIVNAPPPDTLADLLNRRNKVHHLDLETDEDMIPIFTHDVTGKPRNNKRLLNRRNWCSIRPYDPELSPPLTPESERSLSPPPQRGLLRRFSSSYRERGPSYRPDAPRPPVSNAGGFFARRPSSSRRDSTDSQRPNFLTRTLSLTRGDFGKGGGGLFRRNTAHNKPDDGGINGNWGSESEDDSSKHDGRPPPQKSGIRGGSGGRDEDEDGYFPAMTPALGRDPTHHVDAAPTSIAGGTPQTGFQKPQFYRTPTGLSEKQRRNVGSMEINLEGGLDICLNVEVNCKDPAGITMPYRLLVPALWYDEDVEGEASHRLNGGMKRWVSFMGRKRKGNGKEERFAAVE